MFVWTNNFWETFENTSVYGERFYTENAGFSSIWINVDAASVGVCASPQAAKAELHYYKSLHITSLGGAVSPLIAILSF